MDEKIATVPIIIYEKERDRHERENKRWILIIVLLVVLLFVSNTIWIYVWNQYETVAYTQDGEGINNVNIGEQGDLVNEPDSDYSTEKETP